MKIEISYSSQTWSIVSKIINNSRGMREHDKLKRLFRALTYDGPYSGDGASTSTRQGGLDLLTEGHQRPQIKCKTVKINHLNR